MEKIKNIFYELDYLDLKIMKIGLKVCFFIALIAIAILSIYLLYSNTIFLYNIGLLLFKVSTYLSIEFIICGIIVDKLKKQVI